MTAHATRRGIPGTAPSVDHAVGNRPERCGKPLRRHGDEMGTTGGTDQGATQRLRTTSTQCGQTLHTESWITQGKHQVVHNPQDLLLTLMRLTTRHGEGVL